MKVVWFAFNIYQSLRRDRAEESLLQNGMISMNQKKNTTI